MTDSSLYIADEATPQNSRALARKIAAEMVQNHELPNSEAVRKRIVAATGGRLNPSALTMQTEIKAWYAEEFWPTYHAMGSLPEDSSVPAEVRSIFQASFQTMVVQLFAAAKAGFQSEREDFQRQIDEADQVVRELQRSVGDHELRAAEAQERYQAEAHEHALAKERIEALAGEVRDLNAKLHAAHEQQATHEAELKEVRQTERTRADTQIEEAFREGRRHLLEIDALRQRIKSMELSLDGQKGENRRLVLEHAKSAAETGALQTELANTRAAHAKEVERMTAALRAAQAGAAQGERMKPTVRPTVRKATGAGAPAGRVRRSLHKPTRP